MKIVPLAGYVVVKRLEEASQTPSGIILTDSAKEKPQRGTVVAVGPGKAEKPAQVKEGQIVLFKKYGPTEVEIEGEELLLLEEEDVLAIIE
jgi:chaperonin GroES